MNKLKESVVKAMNKRASEWKLGKLIAEDIEQEKKLHGSIPITNYAVYWNIQVFNDMKELDVPQLSKKAQDAIFDDIEVALQGGFSKGEIQLQKEDLEEEDIKILNEDLLLEFFLNFEEKDLDLDDVEIDLGNTYEELPESYVKFRQLANKKKQVSKMASIISKEILKSAKVNKKAIAESEYFDIIEVDENGETIDIIESDYTNGVSAVIEKAKEEAVDGKHIIVVNRYTELDEDGNEFVNDDLNETMWDSEKDIDKYGVIFYDKYEGVDNVAIVDTEEKAKEVLKMLNELEDIEDETEREIMWEDINNMVNNYKERFSREIENSNGFYKGIKFINYNDKVKPSVY